MKACCLRLSTLQSYIKDNFLGEFLHNFQKFIINVKPVSSFAHQLGCPKLVLNHVRVYRRVRIISPPSILFAPTQTKTFPSGLQEYVFIAL